jgi:hypothetical protein
MYIDIDTRTRSKTSFQLLLCFALPHAFLYSLCLAFIPGGSPSPFLLEQKSVRKSCVEESPLLSDGDTDRYKEMRLELKEFAKAARTMHQQPGGIKRTRLMLHLRPYKSRKTFVLKVTDGRTTLTTRVEHQGQVKLVEALLGDFVTECTRVSAPAAGPASAAGHATPSPLAAGVAASATLAASGAPQSGGAATKAAGQAVGRPSGLHASSQQQQKPNKQGNKGKKGRKN